MLSDAEFAPALGGLLLSPVRVDAPMLLVRAARWWRGLSELGIAAPFFVVHDLGLLLTLPREQIVLGPRPGVDLALARSDPFRLLLERYHAFVAEVADGEVVRSAQSAKLGDDLVIVVLARLLSSVQLSEEDLSSPSASGASRPLDAGRSTPGLSAASRPLDVGGPSPRGGRSPERPLPLDPSLFGDLAPRLTRLFQAAARESDGAYLHALDRARLRILTLLDALDVDTLLLLGMFGDESMSAGTLAHVDLLAAVSSPMASDIVRFSLELLPSVLETHRAYASTTHAEHGYGGVARRGAFDSLVLTELAWDDEEIARRWADSELLYFSREQAPETVERLHIVLIDASASMRGDREVFARGLAIALGKRLQLGREEVWFRFFDSRLYDVKRVRAQASLAVAWILGFKGERGRNPARVFAQLATELTLLRRVDSRELVVHVLTHAALHVARPLVQEIRRLAHLFCVFILPSGGVLDLEWLDLVESYTAIDATILAHKGERVSAATKIVDAAANRRSLTPYAAVASQKRR